MPWLVCASKSFPSARLLRDTIEELSGIHLYITSKKEPERVAVRYGGNLGATRIDAGLNTLELVRTCANKAAFASLMRDNDIHAPEFHRTGVPTAYPVLVRETLYGFGGQGIHVVENEEQFNQVWRNGYYWVPFYRISREYRLHFLGGQVVKIFEKVSESDTEPAYPIRNNDRGYHFSIRERPHHGQSIRALAERLAQIPVLARGFMALDVGFDRDADRLVVLEANSAPGLNENTARDYAQYIIGALGDNNEILRTGANTSRVRVSNTGTQRRS